MKRETSENSIKKIRKLLLLYTHTFLFYERYRDRAEKGNGITRRNIVEINQSDGTGKTPMDGFPREWFLHRAALNFHTWPVSTVSNVSSKHALWSVWSIAVVADY